MSRITEVTEQTATEAPESIVRRGSKDSKNSLLVSPKDFMLDSKDLESPSNDNEYNFNMV